MKNVKVVKMYADVKLPEYATPGSACFDIYAHELVNVGNNTETYSTGLKFKIPEGYAMMIYSRSGHGFNNDIRLANCVGVIDSDYIGELKVKLTNDDYELGYVDVHVGQRIAQGMIIPIEQVSFEVVDELTETVRGNGGFGSTGVN